MFILLNKLDI